MDTFSAILRQNSGYQVDNGGGSEHTWITPTNLTNLHATKYIHNIGEYVP